MSSNKENAGKQEGEEVLNVPVIDEADAGKNKNPIEEVKTSEPIDITESNVNGIANDELATDPVEIKEETMKGYEEANPDVVKEQTEEKGSEVEREKSSNDLEVNSTQEMEASELREEVVHSDVEKAPVVADAVVESHEQEKTTVEKSEEDLPQRDGQKDVEPIGDESINVQDEAVEMAPEESNLKETDVTEELDEKEKPKTEVSNEGPEKDEGAVMEEPNEKVIPEDNDGVEKNSTELPAEAKQESRLQTDESKDTAEQKDFPVSASLSEDSDKEGKAKQEEEMIEKVVSEGEKEDMRESEQEDNDLQKAEPPIIDQKTEEEDKDTIEAKKEGEVEKPLDFYYDNENYMSKSFVTEDSGIPINILQLFHSFGYDCKKRSNLCILPGPTALFAAGNLVHLLNLTDGTHQFLRSCGGGGIGAVAVHPQLKYFAVAEKGTKPYLLLYEFPSLKLYRILKEGTEKAYSFIDFNPNGNLLASVGCSPDFMLTVWDWMNEKIMLRTKAFSQDVFRVKFSPEQEGQLTSSGSGHIRFWKMARTFTGLKLKGELGRFGKTSLTDIDGYVQLPDGKVLSGSEWGNMLLWDGGLIKVEICRKNLKPCHVGSIQQLVIDEGELITIGCDGFVRVWEMESIDTADTTDESDVFEVEPMNELRVGADVQLTSMVKLQDAKEQEASDESPSSIWFAQDANGGLWKLDLSFSHTTKPPEKLYSFTAGLISGLATSPASHLLAVTGDSQIRLYDYLTKAVLCEYKCSLLSNGTSLIWPGKLVYEKCDTLIAGFSNGLLRVLTLQVNEDAKELVIKQAMKPHTSEITALAIDNDGKILATGSKDKTVFFFNMRENLDPIGFVEVPGPVSHIQWSPETFNVSTLLVSCSNGKVTEIEPPVGSYDTSHSFKISSIKKRHFTFQSVKSRLRRNEAREKKRLAKEKRLKEKQKELRRRKERGEEFTADEEKEFLQDDQDDEEEEESLFFPPEPSPILSAHYTAEDKFVVSMGGYDAGYLYECEFSKDAQNPDIEPSEPFNSLAVPDSNDIPATCVQISTNSHNLLVGFENGAIRVYPLQDKVNYIFDMSVLELPYWQLNMHDNDTGFVSNIAESHDGAYVFTGGNDGNIFGYNFLPYEEISKAMEGKRARLPSSRRAPDEIAADDIDNPEAYSIEDAKLKAEHDRYIKEAENKKTEERRKITKLRHSFAELLKRNENLPQNVRLKRDEFELDPSLRKNMIKTTDNRIERVKLEMQWDKQKLALATQKLQDRFSSMLDCDKITVHSFESNHTVSSYRITRLADEYLQLKKSMEERVYARRLEAEGGMNGGLGNGLDMGRKKSDNDEELDEQDTFLHSTVQKHKGSILHGRQAEKVAKALKKAEEAKKKREQRQKEWEDLNKGKPVDNYEDPADVAAIQQAKSNIGDFKLKTSTDYIVPEHLRMDTEKKKVQILLLHGLIYQSKKEFNDKLIELRDDKIARIDQIRDHVTELKSIQKKINRNFQSPIPKVPKMKLDELPHKKYEYTRHTLIQFQDSERERLQASKSKERAGEGMFGGFKGADDEAEDSPKSHAGTKSIKSRSTMSSADSRRRSKVSVSESHTEEQMAKINEIRLIYQRDRLLRLISESISEFDAELQLLRHDKTSLDVDLKMADLRQITLLEELLLLKEYEKREKTLSGRVSSKRTELNEVYSKVSEMQSKLETKRRDIDKLLDREKGLYVTFNSSLGENNKFSDYLNKVFKKKIKRAKKKTAVEDGDEEDSTMSSDEESDWSSEEEEDDSIEGGFDDTICPPGCDLQLYNDVIALREKRLDLEEALVEEKKAAEQLKKDTDALVKKAKVMENQLKTALGDLEAFQVEKQGKLNELDVVVPLCLHQVEHVSNAMVPADLTPCLVFTNQSLIGLQRRIKELQHEKSEQRSFYRDAKMQHVRLIKDRKVMEVKIEKLEEKCEQMMMLKFGRIVDLDKLDSITVNKIVEELRERLNQNNIKNASKLLRLDNQINGFKDHITLLTRENTAQLERYNVLVNEKTNLEKDLDQRQKSLQFDERTESKADVRERQRLMQLVQLQAQEIQALKEEIGLLSRKGGHILPPAQPPLGQEEEV